MSEQININFNHPRYELFWVIQEEYRRKEDIKNCFLARIRIYLDLYCICIHKFPEILSHQFINDVMDILKKIDVDALYEKCGDNFDHKSSHGFLT